MMLFKWRHKIKNHLNSILIMSYKFPSNLCISPIFNRVSMQMESKWNTEGMQFKWSLLNTTIGTIYHKSMERNLKRMLKNISFKCKSNWFKMHFFLLRETPNRKGTRTTKSYHCYHQEQRIYWFEKNYLFEKMCAFDFSKLAMVCILYHCRAWYAFHTIAEMKWVHNSVIIATRTLKFIP